MDQVVEKLRPVHMIMSMINVFMVLRLAPHWVFVKGHLLGAAYNWGRSCKASFRLVEPLWQLKFEHAAQDSKVSADNIAA